MIAGEAALYVDLAQPRSLSGRGTSGAGRVSRRGGLPELVDEGRTGIVYEPLEPGSLRRAVDAFLCKPLMFQDMRPFVLEKARDFLQGRMQMKYLRLLSEAKEAVAIKEQPRQHA